MSDGPDRRVKQLFLRVLRITAAVFRVRNQTFASLVCDKMQVGWAFGTEQTMMASYCWQRCVVVVCVLACTWGSIAHGFILGNPDFDPWLGTASGTRSGNGRPVTLTWSIVADGTSTPDLSGPNAPSNLINFLDTTFGGNPIGNNPNDLTARPWFELFELSFDRWEELSGVSYVYEPNDSGQTLGAAAGSLGVRGDVRIGGRSINDDGTLAFNYFPNNGDMVINTDEGAFFGNSNNNFRAFRNTVMHELGHGLNLEHVVSSTDNLLLEPSINVGFDGPQLDEVRAVHFFYGDVNEKSNNGQGNDVYTNATDLGTLNVGSRVRVGTDADVPTQRLEASATDFVSISNVNDTDFYSFTIPEPGLLDVTLTPHGGTFTQSGQGGFPTSFDADARVDLFFSVFDQNGTTELVFTDTGGLGSSDILVDLELPAAGEYFISVGGVDDTIQLYELNVSLSAETFLEADFNEDSAVDVQDLSILRAAIGITDFGDADEDGDTDGADFLIWQRQFNQQVSGSVANSVGVPEPSSVVLIGLSLTGFGFRRHRHR